MTRADVANAWLDDYRDRVDERTLEMARMRVEEGLSYAEIGARVGLTKQRVHQLLQPLGLEPAISRQAVRISTLTRAHARVVAGELTLAEAAGELGYAHADSLRSSLHAIGLKVRMPVAIPEHGTDARYQQGCSCDECRKAHAEYRRELYHRNRASAKAREQERVKSRAKRASKRRKKEAVE